MKKKRGTSAHQSAIDSLVLQSDAVQTKRWKRNLLRAILPDATDCDEADEARSLFGDSTRFRLVPDAYEIREERKEVVFYEVEDANVLTERKLSEYLDLEYFLDEIYWSVRLVAVDIYMNMREIDLFAFQAAQCGHTGIDCVIVGNAIRLQLGVVKHHG